MPALSSHLHGHPLLYPFLAIVVCPMPSCRVLSRSLPASQAGRTSGYNLLAQFSALPVRNRTPKDRGRPLDHLLLPVHSSSPCPSAFTQPRFSTFSPDLSSSYLASLFYFFINLFSPTFSQTGAWAIWPEIPQISGQESQAALVCKPFGLSELKQEHCPACLDPSTRALLAEWEAGLSIAGHTLCACQHPAPLQFKYASRNRCTGILPFWKSFT